jgi:nucleolar protein 4
MCSAGISNYSILHATVSPCCFLLCTPVCLSVILACLLADKVTKNSKGSAFVKFQTPEAALRCVESCEQLPGANMGAATPAAKTKKNGISATEALSSLVLTIKGRPFRVDLAVDRDEAKRLKDDSSAKSGKDKRNLYLANEGLLVDSAVSLKRHGDAQKSNNDMSEEDRDKRRRSQNEKKKKLVNPLYFVSPTRLSIRNLKKSVNHSELFNLCYKAAKAGLQHGLVERRDMEEYLVAQSVPIRQRTPELLAVPPMEGVAQNLLVRKAKVMLDASKLRGADKAAQSRGYGFVEFKHHAHALACLRELNNNSEYGKQFATQYGAKAGKKHNLIVDFSLENFQKVVILNSRVEKRKLLSQAAPAAAASKQAAAAASSTSEDGERERVSAEKADSGGDSDAEKKEKKSTKSRYEKKLEHAQKRKAKELKRKENKKRKVEESEDSSSNNNNNNNNNDANVYRGFKRIRAKSKGK